MRRTMVTRESQPYPEATCIASTLPEIGDGGAEVTGDRTAETLTDYETAQTPHRTSGRVRIATTEDGMPGLWFDRRGTARLTARAIFGRKDNAISFVCPLLRTYYRAVLNTRWPFRHFIGRFSDPT